MAWRKAVLKRAEKLRRHYYKNEPPSVAAAATFFGLDLNNARQREKLLYVLADLSFGVSKQGRPKGTKTSWGHTKTSWGTRLMTLGRLYYETKYQNPAMSDARIARLIGQYKEFKNDDPDQIRQRLPAARKEYDDWLDWARDEAAADADAEAKDDDEDDEDDRQDDF